jgi:hypothetical protein
MGREPSLARLGIDRRQRGALGGASGPKGGVLRPRGLAPRLGLGVRKRGEDLARDVARVANQVHHLVIAEQ